MGHAVMENRHGLAVAGRVTQADGTAESRTSETLAAEVGAVRVIAAILGAKACGWCSSLVMNFWKMSPRCNRSRFLVKAISWRSERTP
jgi:hypothetical protein